MVRSKENKDIIVGSARSPKARSLRDRYFQSHYESKGYSPEVKEICLKMYLNGMGFRGIERVTGIHHTTIMNWVKELGEELSTSEETDPPQVVSLDELQTYIGRKTNKIWIRSAIDYYLSGILAFVIGDRSSQNSTD